MLCQVKQTVSGMSASYEIISNAEQIGSAEMPNNFLFGTPCDIFFRDTGFHLKYLHTLSREREKNKVTMRQHLPYAISKDGKSYGKMYAAVSDGNFFTRYGYVCLELPDGAVFSMYEIGLGKDGIVYPIYKGEKIVAEIDKGCVVHNNLDDYSIFAEDEEACMIAVLLCIYLDANSFANRGEIVKSGVSKMYFKTTNKRLNAKYDPAFKARILRQSV